MLPADTVVRAALRWLYLLRTSTSVQGWSLIRADATYTDLTQTQYASALEWLQTLQLVTASSDGLVLSAAAKALPALQGNQLLFERSLEKASPPWLIDADLLVPDDSELPQDAAKLASTLGLSDRIAFHTVRQIHGRIDLAQQARIGSAGEKAVVELLEAVWPGSTVHVATTSDGFGYDILFRHADMEWHLEVKSTTRRGRLVLYLSRHEHEVGLREPNWRLIVAGLDDNLNLQAIATIRHSQLLNRAPNDSCAEAEWKSAAHQVTPEDLQPGLSFLHASLGKSPEEYLPILRSGVYGFPSAFAWMPPQPSALGDQ